MTKARNISDLLDANGDVKVDNLDNVPASDDASALTTGTLSIDRLGISGTKDATTFLRGDNTFAVAGSPSIDDNGTATAITIDSSQNVGIGETTPLGKLHIKTGDSGHGAETHADELVIENDTNGGLTLAMGNSNSATIAFANTNSNEDGKIVYRNNERELRFSTAGSERMYIDSSGRVAIGSTTVTGARLYVPADGQTTDAWVRHGSTSSASGSWGGGKQVQVDWQILHSVSYVFEFLTASYGSRKHFVVGSYYPGSQHQTIMTDNGTGSMTQGGASSGERWTSSGGTHGVYCVRITSAQGLENALVTLI